MNPITFTNSLIQLSKQGLGIKQSSVLFCIATGCDHTAVISQATGIPINLVHSRTTVLKRKKLITGAHRPDGRLVFSLTPKGRKVVEGVVK